MAALEDRGFGNFLNILKNWTSAFMKTQRSNNQIGNKIKWGLEALTKKIYLHGVRYSYSNSTAAPKTWSHFIS